MRLLRMVIPGVIAAVAIGYAMPGVAGESTINILAKEWKISADKTSAAAGKVTFVVKNMGDEDHEVEIVQLDGKTPETLPLTKDGGADEKWVEPHSLGEVEDIKPGASKQFSLNLKPGSYALICNMVEKEKDGSTEAHYSKGMRVAFTVQ